MSDFCGQPKRHAPEEQPCRNHSVRGDTRCRAHGGSRERALDREFRRMQEKDELLADLYTQRAVRNRLISRLAARLYDYIGDADDPLLKEAQRMVQGHVFTQGVRV